MVEGTTPKYEVLCGHRQRIHFSQESPKIKTPFSNHFIAIYNSLSIKNWCFFSLHHKIHLRKRPNNFVMSS